MPNEEKKPIKTPSSTFAEIFIYLFPLFLLFFLLSFISINTERLEDVFYVLIDKLFYPIFFLIFLLFISVSAFVFYSYKLSQILAEEREKAVDKQKKPEKSIQNRRWQRVLDHISSNHPNDWRIAVLEADTILDDFLVKKGYVDESVSGKLKQIKKEDLSTLENAWEAHKKRNKIAHDPSFEMDKREAERIIELYRSVFEEMGEI